MNKPLAQDLVIQNIMSTVGGREFIWGHLSMCGVRATGFTSDKTPSQIAYEIGMRDAGLALETQIKFAAPGDYLTMIKESNDE